MANTKDQLRKVHRKWGRNARPGKHHQGQLCGLKNCRELLDSRVYSKELRCYVSKEVSPKARVSHNRDI